VLPVAIGPDVLDDLDDRPSRPVGWFGGDGRGLAEVLQQRGGEAVEDSEVRLVRELLALARTAAQHLLEQNEGLDRAKQDDELQIRDVYAGREHVHCDDDARIGPVAELANALKRAIHPASDLLNKGIATAEDIAADVDELVRVRNVRQVMDGEDQTLRLAAVALLVLVGVLLKFLDDLAIGVGRGGALLDLRGGKLPFIL